MPVEVRRLMEEATVALDGASTRRMHSDTITLISRLPRGRLDTRATGSVSDSWPDGGVLRREAEDDFEQSHLVCLGGISSWHASASDRPGQGTRTCRWRVDTFRGSETWAEQKTANVFEQCSDDVGPRQPQQRNAPLIKLRYTAEPRDDVTQAPRLDTQSLAENFELTAHFGLPNIERRISCAPRPRSSIMRRDSTDPCPGAPPSSRQDCFGAAAGHRRRHMADEAVKS
ncbi:hypothetical protein IWZ03DRAFT_117595 [Phyllosticta citriasiana]|uniref:Uncharacterized protein n=1 Tax=Phyllosticta citriasiana TaxID=595635 RepID=A0ABR1KXM7_9PEZI